jgi:hypothetical protein
MFLSVTNISNADLGTDEAPGFYAAAVCKAVWPGGPRLIG